MQKRWCVYLAGRRVDVVFILTFIFFVFIVKEAKDELKTALLRIIHRSLQDDGVHQWFESLQLQDEMGDYTDSVDPGDKQEDLSILCNHALSRIGLRNENDTQYEYEIDEESLPRWVHDEVIQYRKALDELREAKGTPPPPPLYHPSNPFSLLHPQQNSVPRRLPMLVLVLVKAVVEVTLKVSL